MADGATKLMVLCGFHSLSDRSLEFNMIIAHRLGPRKLEISRVKRPQHSQLKLASGARPTKPEPKQ